MLNSQKGHNRNCSLALNMISLTEDSLLSSAFNNRRILVHVSEGDQPSETAPVRLTDRFLGQFEQYNNHKPPAQSRFCLALTHFISHSLNRQLVHPAIHQHKCPVVTFFGWSRPPTFPPPISLSTLRSLRKRDPDPGGKLTVDERAVCCAQRHKVRRDPVDRWKVAPGFAGNTQRPGGENLWSTRPWYAITPQWWRWVLEYQKGFEYATMTFSIRSYPHIQGIS